MALPEKTTQPNPPNLRKAAHNWWETKKDMLGAEGADAVKASEKHRNAIRKLADVVQYDMREGGQEP